MRFALFGNIFQPRKSAAIQQLICMLEERRAELLIDQEFYHFLVDQQHIVIHPTELIADNQFTADIVISMGGDGTFLKAASRVGEKQVPIVGINMGRLGFLADISPEDIETMINDIYEGHYELEHRAVLKVEFFNQKGELIKDRTDYPYALNDVAILKHDSSSMISIHTDINQNYLTTYQADGIVIATPTGSTAYSLSVGGPILEPTSGTIGITPIAAHTLNVRPVVLRDDCTISLQVSSRSGNYLVAIDGRSANYPEDVRLRITKAPFNIIVLKRQNQTFFQTLRQKMMWGADGRD
ncbi:MAG: NAD kinase [Bacteroidaceae bacterium]|nr:NAD kinase [Bacteroidaceae bacterium]MCF0185074.1 NAD kinase [Bacteroidaceae bacterium]